MSSPLSDPVALVPILSTLVVIIAIARVAYRHTAARTLTRTIVASLVTWAVVVSIIGIRGIFGDPERTTVPPIAFGLVVPMLAVTALLATSTSARRLLASISQRWLIGVQLYRVIGGMFLILLAQHRLPAEFALPAGWGDIAIGALAPVFALGFRDDSSRWRSAAVAWNVLGVLDLIVAVSTGVLTAPGHWHRLAFDAPNTTMTMFPYMLVPTFLVPIALMLHAASLRRLLAGSRSRATVLELDAIR